MNRKKISNIVFVAIIVLLLIPQTRQPIQVVLNKIKILLVSPSALDASESKQMVSYDWNLEDIHSKHYNFYNAKGKVVIINFWATWCPPCIAEMPSLQKLYNHYAANEEVVFLLINEENRDKVISFLNKNEYTFDVYKPTTTYPDVFNISSIPRTFVINRKGKIIMDETGAANWFSDSVKNIIDNALLD